MAGGGALTCPHCSLPHDADERFCRNCGMPLVHSGEPEEPALTSKEEWARKVRPQYARGDLVKVAGGRNQSEAELIQNILIEEGIPSIVRRTRGFDVPDFLAAGPRDVMVAESGYEAALSLLEDNDLAPREPVPGQAPPGIDSPRKLAVGIFAVAGIGTGIAWVLYQVAG